MAWGLCAKSGILLTLLLTFLGNGQAAVITQGVKLQVSQVRVEKKKTFFRHKNNQFVYSGTPHIISNNNSAAEIFFTFDELKILLRENKIALGGVAGGGGGK